MPLLSHHQAVHEGHDGGKDHPEQTGIEQQNEEDEAVGADGVHKARNLLRQHAGEDPTAVQRRNGKQVEDRQQNIQEQTYLEQEKNRIDNSVLRQNQLPAEGNDDLEANQEDYRKQDVAGRTGRRDEEVVPSWIPQVAGVDRNRLGPAEEESCKESDQGEDDGPDKVDVHDGIQGDTPQVAGRMVSEIVRRPGMGGLVNTQRKEQDHYADDHEGRVKLEEIHHVMIPQGPSDAIIPVLMNSLLFNAAFALYVAGLAASAVGFWIKKAALFRSAIVAVGLAFGLHSAFLVHTGVTMGHFPMTNLRESFSFFAWTVTLCFLISYLRYRIKPLGIFLLPTVTVLMLGAVLMRSSAPVALNSYWLYIHTSFVFLAYGMFVVTFIAGLLYLFQERELKSKKPKTFYYILPSLEMLDDLFIRFLVAGFLFMTVGLLAGVIWAEKDWIENWQSDPKVVATLVTWGIYLILIYLRTSAGWRGKRAALINVAGFISALFAFLGTGFLGGFHKF
jgi:cytochrome c-type biogenesis protein CcsB